jgi:esterase/lipase
MRDISARQYLDKQTLKNIRIPVSVGIADKDQMVSLEETTGVFETLPDASLFVLPGSKHQLETVNYNLLAQTISGLTRQV